MHVFIFCLFGLLEEIIKTEQNQQQFNFWKDRAKMAVQFFGTVVPTVEFLVLRDTTMLQFLAPENRIPLEPSWNAGLWNWTNSQVYIR